MPLVYLLYRCPHCGHDPMEGEKDRAVCPACGVQYSRGGEGGLIRVQDPSGGSWDVPGHRLTAAMDARREQDGFHTAAPGTLIRRAKVEKRQSGAEAPVEWGGELIGFAEAMGEAAAGALELTLEALIFRPSVVGRADPGERAAREGRAGLEGKADPGDGVGAPQGPDFSQSWPLLQIRAVQTSSSSLQFSPLAGGLVQFRFLNDSPYRWESLLREGLRTVYKREGMGEIVEFQPRIIVE